MLNVVTLFLRSIFFPAKFELYNLQRVLNNTLMNGDYPQSIKLYLATSIHDQQSHAQDVG